MINFSVKHDFTKSSFPLGALPNRVHILNDLIGGEGESLGKLMRVIVQVAIDKKGEGLGAVERVGLVKVEFRLGKVFLGSNCKFLVGDIWRDIHPRVCHTIDIAVSDVRGRLELDVKIFIDFHRIGTFGLDIRDLQSAKERR